MIENAKLLQAIQNIINQSYSSGDEYSYRGGRDWYNEQAEGNDFHKLVRARDAMKKGDYDKYADFVAALVRMSNDHTNPKDMALKSERPAQAEGYPSPVMRGKNDWSNPEYMSPYEPAVRAMTAYEMADTYAERHARQPQAKPVNTAQTTSSVETKSARVPKWYDAYPELEKNCKMIVDMAETDPEGATRWAKAFTTNMRTLKGAPPGYVDGLRAHLLAQIYKRAQRTGRDMSEDKIWPASQETTRPTSRNPYQSQMPDTRFRNNY